MHTILVITHNRNLSLTLRHTLEEVGYHTFTPSNTGTAIHTLRRERPPFVILDAADQNALEVLRVIRHDLPDIYVLMMAEDAEDSERIIALEMGADDFVVSLNPREIVARVRSGFRRLRLTTHTNAVPQSVIRCGDLMVDPLRHRVMLGGHPIELTPTEFNLLVTLMRHPGVAFSRTELMDKRHNTDYESLERTLDSHIRNLRRKIEPDTASPQFIQTVYGVGYRFGEI
jgi:two-component system, OmpR family, alkaline phosphatase synthesis response regulator PhoP